MTLTITLDLSPEVEAKLQEKIAQRDSEGVRRLLADALTPIVENLLRQITEELSEDDFELLMEQLADDWASYMKPGTPVLSDYAVSRASIYEDHSQS